MTTKKKDITQFNILVSIIGTKCKPEVKNAIKLFEGRQIHTKREAIKTITMLESSGKQQILKLWKA